MKQLNQKDFSPSNFIAPNASVMGDVTIGENSSIWYNAVVRGDVEKIIIGKYTNIQDGAIIHGDPGKPTIIEDYVTIGHRAVIHSAHVAQGTLIGIGAIILDGVTVGEGSIIGAGSVVTKDVPPHSLMIGIPARHGRFLSIEESQELIQHAQKYAQLAQFHNGTSTDK